MRMVLLLAFGLMVLALPGCETIGSPTGLTDTTVDRTFDKKRIRFRNSLGTPVYESYYIKVFEVEGRIALCGVAIRSEGGIMDELWDRWLENAFVVINGRSNKITSARFMNMVDRNDNPKRSRCVKTDRIATTSELAGRPGLVGSSITVWF